MKLQLRRLRKRGFTLPEVLVTVTVVAVLAAVVVPAVTQYVGRGNGPATATDIEQVRQAITGFITDMRTPPLTIYDLTQATAPSYATANGGTWHGPYLSGTVTQTTGGTTGQGLGASGTQCGTGLGTTCSAAFTSSGLNLQLADTLIQSNGTIYANMIYPNVCWVVQHVDSLIDDGAAGTGNLTWTNPGNCDSNHNTTYASAVKLTLATIGK